MRRGSFKRRLPRGRHSCSRYNSYIAPALIGFTVFSVLLASAFFLHLFPGTPSSGPIVPNTTSNSALNTASDKDMLRIATSDAGLIATVSFSPGDSVTRVQVENTGLTQFRHVKVSAEGRKVLGILSQLSPDEKKRFRIKVYDAIPIASVIMLDSEEKNGRTQIDIKPYKAPRQNSFTFELSGRGHSLYDVCTSAWTKLLDEAEDFDPERHLTQDQLVRK